MKRVLRLYRILSVITLMILILSILVPCMLWKQIPEQIPIHYNSVGEADGWGGKGSLILIVFIDCFTMAGLFFTGFIIKVSALSVHATEKDKENLERVYPMTGWMNLVVTGMFGYIIICSATGRNLGKLFLPVVLAGVFLPMLYLIPGKNRRADTQDTEFSDTVKLKDKTGEIPKEKYIRVEKKGDGERFRTRVDWWMALILIGTAALPVILMIREYNLTGQIEWGMMIMLWILVPLFVMLSDIRYILYPEHLKVCCGFFGVVRIPYSAITNIRKTMNPLSSAAMSLKRIQIDYRKNGRNEMILISPKDRDLFIRILKQKISEEDRGKNQEKE